jgi:hypothetical protein
MVTFDPLSGPKGSPLDAKKPNPAGGAFLPDPANCSTGALSTGIGYGSPPIIGPISDPIISNTVNGIRKAGFDDDQLAGTTPLGRPAAAQNTVDSTYLYIGGGRDVMVGPSTLGKSTPQPYTAGVGILAAGNGGSRDGGAGPAFTGFGLKMVTAVGAVANGVAVEAGFINRSGVALVASQSVFGSTLAATAAPA